MFKDQFEINPNKVLNHLKNGDLVIVSPESDGMLILSKRYHAELVGPGSAIGGLLDLDCTKVTIVGNISLTKSESYQDSQKAYQTRQKWIKYLQDLVKLSDPLVRSKKILRLLDNCCNFNQRPDMDTLPDSTLAMLVGVLPKTIDLAKTYRHTVEPLTSDRKIKKKPYYNSFNSNCLSSNMYSSIF